MGKVPAARSGLRKETGTVEEASDYAWTFGLKSNLHTSEEKNSRPPKPISFWFCEKIVHRTHSGV